MSMSASCHIGILKNNDVKLENTLSRDKNIALRENVEQRVRVVGRQYLVYNNINTMKLIYIHMIQKCNINVVGITKVYNCKNKSIEKWI
jgi:hypothetical protein